MKRESEIEHEVGDFWVHRAGPGHFEVYQTHATHGHRIATFHYSKDPERARAAAITEANIRAAAVTHR